MVGAVRTLVRQCRNAARMGAREDEMSRRRYHGVHHPGVWPRNSRVVRGSSRCRRGMGLRRRSPSAAVYRIVMHFATFAATCLFIATFSVSADTGKCEKVTAGGTDMRYITGDDSRLPSCIFHFAAPLVLYPVMGQHLGRPMDENFEGDCQKEMQAYVEELGCSGSHVTGWLISLFVVDVPGHPGAPCPRSFASFDTQIVDLLNEHTRPVPMPRGSVSVDGQSLVIDIPPEALDIHQNASLVIHLTGMGDPDVVKIHVAGSTWPEWLGPHQDGPVFVGSSSEHHHVVDLVTNGLDGAYFVTEPGKFLLLGMEERALPLADVTASFGFCVTPWTPDTERPSYHLELDIKEVKRSPYTIVLGVALTMLLCANLWLILGRFLWTRRKVPFGFQAYMDAFMSLFTTVLGPRSLVVHVGSSARPRKGANASIQPVRGGYDV